MSTVKTTIKTDVCSYSEYRIYPGRGRKFVARDGRVSTFLNQKCASLFHQKIKAVKLKWSVGWRRMNKKLTNQGTTTKRRARKTVRLHKAIEGLSLDDIKQKRAQYQQASATAQKAALTEAKARQQKRKQVNKK
ncbi:60S ribosomal L24 [Cryptosporidium xiaoi]|uniref:60S ribosomal L24 n=1 Tax=Cryptosporidium xiaoi TaxID=659607 RepID=A0AAV9XXN1_9CRYT|nr:60S ribosomal L24 [Cryptosporidium bovis]